jgi:hypothetical protein
MDETTTKNRKEYDKKTIVPFDWCRWCGDEFEINSQKNGFFCSDNHARFYNVENQDKTVDDEYYGNYDIPDDPGPDTE